MTRPGAAAGWPLRRRVAGVFAVGGGLLVVGLTAAGVGLVRLDSEQTELTARLTPVALDGSDYFRALLDEETAVRGYALTGRADFLEPYRTGQVNQRTARANVLRELPKRPELARRFALLQARADAWQRRYAEPTIAAIGADGPNTRRAPSLTAGRTAFDAIRGAYASFSAELDAQRQRARAQLHTTTVAVGALFIDSTILTLVGSALGWLALRRWVIGPLELARIESARTELAQANARLEERTVELSGSNAGVEQFAYVASHDLFVGVVRLPPRPP